MESYKKVMKEHPLISHYYYCFSIVITCALRAGMIFITKFA
jgi:hypothetical protein